MENNILNKHLKNSVKNSYQVCIIGLGYIGLPTAALLANRGHNVLGVDIVQKVVDTVNRGEIHIVEPELDIFVKDAVKNKKLKASTEPKEADIFIIAVPTPFHKSTDEFIPNIDYVVDATKSIAPYLKEGNMVILESTSPVGTTEKIYEILNELRSDLFPSVSNTKSSKIYIAHCPERVLPGQIMRELIENDRIVGGVNKASTQKVAEFYKEIVKGEVLETNDKTAELCKLVENSYRDVNIAFANELSMICDKFGIDVWELRELANRHPRVNILYPGVGVGGHCIAVDPWFIVHSAKEESKLIKTAREVNLYKTEWVIEKIKNEVKNYELELLRKNLQNKTPTIALMGLAFKPDIDDLRESPSLYIAKRLSSDFENVICVEPNIPIDLKISLDQSTQNKQFLQLSTPNTTIESADIIVFLVAHKEFKSLYNNKSLLTNKQVLDFCGIL